MDTVVCHNVQTKLNGSVESFREDNPKASTCGGDHHIPDAVSPKKWPLKGSASKVSVALRFAFDYKSKWRKILTLSCPLFSCHIMCCHVWFCCVASRGIASCSVRSCHLFSCPVLFIFSRPVRSCRVVFVSRRVRSCHVWFVFLCPVMSFLCCHVMQFHVIEGG